MIKLWKNDGAVSSVIGVILMVGMTVIMISAVAISVMGFALPESAPNAKIVVVEAEGDMDTLSNNNLILKHKGGDALVENYTKIIITGRGYAYTGGDTGPLKDIRVTYRDLTGKNYYYTGQKKIVEGTSWDTGETITLYGYDGINIGSGIIENQGNTVDNKWKLKAGSTVLVTILDTTTNQVIAVSQATVKDA